MRRSQPAAVAATDVRIDGRMPLKEGFRPDPMAGVWMARVGDGVDEDEPDDELQEVADNDDGEESDSGDDGGEFGVVGSFSVNRGGGHRAKLDALDRWKPPIKRGNGRAIEPQDVLDA